MGVVAAQTLLNRIEKRHKLPMKIELAISADNQGQLLPIF